MEIPKNLSYYSISSSNYTLEGQISANYFCVTVKTKDGWTKCFNFDKVLDGLEFVKQLDKQNS